QEKAPCKKHLGALASRDARFPGVRDVLGVVPLEDLLHLRHLLAVLGVHGEQNIAASQFALVLLRLQFWNAIADESAREPASRGADRRAAQSGHDRSRSYEGTEARDRQGSDPRKPPQGSTQDAPGARARRGAFRSLGLLLMRKVPCSLL